VLGGDTLAISGSFTFDFTTTIESQVAITLSGNPTYAGTYTATNLALGALAEVFADDGDLSLTILFANVLDLSPVELQTVDWQGSGPIPPQLQGQDLTGFVEFAPTPAVPEPNSVILLVTLVAMAGFLTRRKLAGGWVIQKNP
jgi:hypothetical protein